MFVPVELQQHPKRHYGTAPPDTPGRVKVFNVRGIARNPSRRYPWPRTLVTLDVEQRATVDELATAAGIAPEAQLLHLYRAQTSSERRDADEDERADLLALAVADYFRTPADDPRRDELRKTITRLRRA